MSETDMTLKWRAQVLCRLLSYVCTGLISCGWIAFSQQKTEHGFYFPIPFKSARQGIQTGLRGYLSGCNKESNDFHVGADLPADAGAPVYAIAGGIVAAKSGQGLAPPAVVLTIRHKPRNGTEFYAVYANIRTSMKPGMALKAIPCTADLHTDGERDVVDV